MESKAKLLGHPVHQMLIVFPLGLLGTAMIFDIVYLFTGSEAIAIAAYWMIVAGVLGGLLAAPFGWIDWSAIPKQTRAKSVGLMHGLGNVIVLLLFIGSWLLRRHDPAAPNMLAHLLVFTGTGLALVTPWLGGELVARLGIGVYNGAHVNSPNSLSGRPASEHAGPKTSLSEEPRARANR